MSIQDFPKTELHFHQQFSSDETCRAYLTSIRWPKGFICPKCSETKYSLRKQKYQRASGVVSTTDHWVCLNKDCREVTSLLAGTVLHNSPKPLPEWMNAMYLMTTSKQGISALRLQRLMGFGSYHTALRVLRELRRCMGVALSDQPKLSGEIELDETTIGRKDEGGKRGRGSETSVKVMGAVERLGDGSGRARLKIIDGYDSDTVADFVKEFIEEGSSIYTDNSSAYQVLPRLGYTLYMQTVTLTDEQKEELKEEGKPRKHRAIQHLPRIHRIFSLFKRVNLGTHQGSFSLQHLQGYLDEYCFRFEYRNRAQLLACRETRPCVRSNASTALLEVLRKHNATKEVGK